MKFYVYKISNTVNDKLYIGKAHKINIRWTAHKTTARNKIKGSYSLIHKAMNKYGFEKFKIEKLFEFDSEEEALSKETELIKLWKTKLPTGYNLTDGGEGISGFEYTKAQRDAMSKRMKGKFSGEKNPFYGKKHTTETRAILSEKRTVDHQLHPEKYRGENHSQSKLTDKKVAKIRNLYFEHGKTQTWLAAKFGVVRATIGNIVTNKIWNHVGEQQTASIKERALLTWNERLGKIIVKEFTCQSCLNKFTIECRENSKQMKKGAKYCSWDCYKQRYANARIRKQSQL